MDKSKKKPFLILVTVDADREGLVENTTHRPLIVVVVLDKSLVKVALQELDQKPVDNRKPEDIQDPATDLLESERPRRECEKLVAFARRKKKRTEGGNDTHWDDNDEEWLQEDEYIDTKDTHITVVVHKSIIDDSIRRLTKDAIELTRLNIHARFELKKNGLSLRQDTWEPEELVNEAATKLLEHQHRCRRKPDNFMVLCRRKPGKFTELDGNVKHCWYQSIKSLAGNAYEKSTYRTKDKETKRSFYVVSPIINNEETGSIPDNYLNAPEVAELLKEFLKLIDEAPMIGIHKTILRKFAEGKTPTEIAEEVGRSESTVSKAKTKFIEWLTI